MEAQQRKSRDRVWLAELATWWELVRRWPGLSGEDKLAWHFVAEQSRAGRERIAIRPGQISDDQGTTDDAGRKRIKNLAAAGLVIVRDHDRQRGVWELELVDPRELETHRKVRWDGQHALAFMDEALPGTLNEPNTSQSRQATGDDLPGSPVPPNASGASTGRPQPVEVRRATVSIEEGHRGTSGASSAALPRTDLHLHFNGDLSPNTSPSPLKRQESLSSSGASERRGSAGGSSPAIPRTFRPAAENKRDEAPRRLGDLATRVAASLPSHEWQENEAAALADRIQLRVADRLLHRKPCLTLAWAVMEGLIPRHEVDALLDRIEQMRRTTGFTTSASAYFNGAAKKLKVRYNVPDQPNQPR